MARLCLWLDTSRQTAAQTADEILSRAWAEAAVPGTQIQSGQAGSTADMGARK
ncbi:MAG TPA: hypothetical protein VGI05_04690 [Streptosporangiaceae bacterium]|jgi:hypothetical protein